MRALSLCLPLLLGTLAGCGSYSMAPDAAMEQSDWGGGGSAEPARKSAGAPGGHDLAEGSEDGWSGGPLADASPDETVPVDDDGAPVQPRSPKKPGETAVEPGRSQPLLIYTANLHLAVYQVETIQKKAIELAKQVGGFLARQDGQVLVLRVPARRFEEVLNGVEGMGDVLSRQIEALDVTEEFRDQTIRLRNLEAVRGQLEKLLERAKDVKAALEVQRELTRITGQIEQIKGRLRFLEDRIAFSTITLRFQPQPRNDAAGASPPAFQLPFGWVQELGLRSLMDVR